MTSLMTMCSFEPLFGKCRVTNPDFNSTIFDFGFIFHADHRADGHTRTDEVRRPVRCSLSNPLWPVYRDLV